MIVFFSPPSSIKSADGYFARVHELDDFFQTEERIYVEVTGRIDHFSVNAIGPKKWHLKVYRDYANTDEFWRLIDEMSSMIYFHSIYNLQEIQSSIQKIPRSKMVIDVHGAVPEELEFLGQNELALEFKKIEQEALSQAQILIVVTKQMKAHLLAKYPRLTDAEFILLPTVKSQKNNGNSLSEKLQTKMSRIKTPVVSYLGGSQKWQNVDQMIDLIRENKLIEFRIYSLQPKYFKSRLRDTSNVSDCRHLDQKEMEEAFKDVSYTLILRDDHIVNRVSCPTKMMDTLNQLVIPILKSPYIGDFLDMGLKYIPVEQIDKIDQFSQDEIRQMLQANIEVLEKLTTAYSNGRSKIVALNKNQNGKTLSLSEFSMALSQISKSKILEYKKKFWSLRFKSKLALFLAHLKIKKS